MRAGRFVHLITLVLPGPLAAQAVAPVALLPGARIGCTMCDGPSQFVDVRAIAATADGVVLTDGSDPHVRAFDRAGNVVFAGSRTGDGPGEFARAAQVWMRDDGTIEALDAQLRRLVRFSRNGSLLGTRTLKMAGFPVAAGYARHARVLYVETTAPRQPALVIIVLPDTSEAPRELPLPRDFPATASGEPAARGNSAIPAGMPIPPVRAEKPHFGEHALRFDGQDRLWVLTERGTGDESVFDLFAPSGAFLGEVRVHARIRQYDISGDALWGVTSDVDNVLFIRHFRIVRSGQPGSSIVPSSRMGNAGFHATSHRKPSGSAK